MRLANILKRALLVAVVTFLALYVCVEILNLRLLLSSLIGAVAAGTSSVLAREGLTH